MLTVCNYHYIREDYSFKYPSIFGVTPKMFENQLKILKHTGDFIHQADIINNTEHILTSKNNYLLVTFDDGLKEQFLYGLPILEAHNIPALFFLSSINFEEGKVSTVHKIHLLRSIIAADVLYNKIKSYNPSVLTNQEKKTAIDTYRFDDALNAELKYLLNFKIPFDKQETIINNIFIEYYNEQDILKELYMSEEHIQYLANSGYLGSHTHSHFPLGLLDDNTIYEELQRSKSYFEALTNSKIKTVAYPYGSKQACTETVFKEAKKADYTIGFTTTPGVNKSTSNNLALMRYDCNDLPGGKNFNA